MERYLQFVARAFIAGAIIVIVAMVSRQVYLRHAAEAGIAGADEDPAVMMLISCETMHNRLQQRHGSIDVADTQEPPRARCRES